MQNRNDIPPAVAESQADSGQQSEASWQLWFEAHHRPLERAMRTINLREWHETAQVEANGACAFGDQLKAMPPHLVGGKTTRV
jgi:hypothetical protein